MSSRFGSLLRTLRLEVELTQEQLAERAGLGVRTVQRLEAGKPPDARLGTVRQLAHVLADISGREREQVWQELLSAHRAQSPADEVPGPVPRRPDPDPKQLRAGALRDPAHPSGLAAEGVMAEAADALARDVHSRWIREEEQRRIHDPFPLPVRWRPASEGVLDHWGNVSGASAGMTAGPLSLEGGLADIADVYRRIPSGRLVVLGGAGSGKSVLMMRFVLDYLGERSSGDRVPVVFSIGSWDPTATALRDWLVDRLLRDHPNLAARAPGRRSTMAAALVDAGWILPVLDGFDEIAAGLHRAALRDLNALSLPLLLTSRTEQFADAARSDLLGRAAGIELTDLTTTDLAHYLPLAARPTAPAERLERPSTVWDPVLDELCDRPDSASSVRLAAVLRTPLMVMLARTLYSDTPGQDPAALLDAARFPTPQSLEEHLLAGFVPSVYQQRQPTVPEAAHPRTWDPDRARRYLGHLARHLDRPGQRNHQDLAWWQLSGSLSLPARVLAIVLACTLVTAVVESAFAALYTLEPGEHVGQVGGLADGLATGPVVGVCFGLAYAIAVRTGRTVFEPSPMRLRLLARGRRTGGAPARSIWAASRTGLLVGGPVGLVTGGITRLLGLFPPAKVHGVLLVPSVEKAAAFDSLLYGINFALAAGLALGLMTALETPLDLRSATTPADLLAVNRTTVAHQALLVTPVVVITITFLWRTMVSSWTGAHVSLWMSFLIGCQCGIVATFAYVLAFTAWGHWVFFGRVLLPLAGRLPWAPMAFLDDAYRKGVLRQVGAVYQFRHDRLQHHLSHVHRDSEHDGCPAAVQAAGGTPPMAR
ncbi:helix-turn-helix domain-containing protein [Kitasatospora sp. NPDC056138]|uniref:helix-turn-helix domain-containing protein n=1 Tax=Kitasatospora sp. NPDC056138 TaxID=3345724 RepID=UPI0035DAF673